MTAFEKEYLVLQPATHSLRQKLNDTTTISRPEQISVMTGILRALKALHNVEYVHLDVKPENIMQVTEVSGEGGTEAYPWKLIDFDSSRTVNEDVGTFTPHYAPIEVAKAQTLNQTIPAKPSMDIFSAGLVLLEMSTGSPLVQTDDKDVLRQMANKADVERELESSLNGLADEDLSTVLRTMLKSTPEERATAQFLLGRTPFGRQIHSVLLRNVVTQKQDELTQKQDELMKQLLDMRHVIVNRLDRLEMNLLDEVKLDAELKKQIGELHRSKLGPLATYSRLCVQSAEQSTDVATLSQITAAMNTALSEVQQEAAKANQQTMSTMLDEIKKLMPQQSNSHQETVAALKRLNDRMTTMNATLSDIDEEVKRLRPFLATKLNMLEGGLLQLLTGENEMRFHYFLLVPKPPTKTDWFSLRLLNKIWRTVTFTEPMLLIPFYFDEERKHICAAPVKSEKLGGHPGFTVNEPKAFIKEHPVLVKMSVLALQIAVRVGLGALAVNLPINNINTQDPFGKLLSETMNTAKSKVMEGLIGEDIAMINKMDELYALPPEELPDELVALVDEYQELTKDKYASLKRWLDKNTPNWEDFLGLDQWVRKEDGGITWQP